MLYELWIFVFPWFVSFIALLFICLLKYRTVKFALFLNSLLCYLPLLLVDIYCLIYSNLYHTYEVIPFVMLQQYQLSCCISIIQKNWFEVAIFDAVQILLLLLWYRDITNSGGGLAVAFGFYFGLSFISWLMLIITSLYFCFRFRSSIKNFLKCLF